MVLLFKDSSDPKTNSMLKAFRPKNEKYDALKSLDNVILLYKEKIEEDKTQKQNKRSNSCSLDGKTKA